MDFHGLQRTGANLREASPFVDKIFYAINTVKNVFGAQMPSTGHFSKIVGCPTPSPLSKICGSAPKRLP